MIIETRSGIQHRCQFAKDQTVEELVEIAGAVVSPRAMEIAPPEDEDAQTTQAGLENENKLSIAERVRFWEEQDKINQTLIPRVIRQNELLTKHIAEHDSLPEVTGKAISQALAGAREEQRQQYEAALDAAKGEIAENARAVSEILAEAREEQRGQYESALDAVKGEIAESARAVSEILAEAREEQRGQYESALDAVKGEIAESARATSEVLAEAREEQRGQYEAALDAAKGEIAESARASLDQALAAVRHETRGTRNMLIFIASGLGSSVSLRSS